MVSTRAGLVHYFEGVVAINGEPQKAQFGRFPEVREGSELRTGQGRAEVLLGPGVILRVADDSAIKMISTSLANVKLELLAGTAILESRDALAGNTVTLFFKDWHVAVSKKGVYRIDADPAQLRIYDGEVHVTAGENGTPVVAKAGQTLPLGPVLVPDQTLGPPGDAFNEWAFQRSQAVEADNATAAQIVDDPALYPSLADASGLALAGYTYFPPTMGYPYMSYGMYGPGVYGSYGNYLSSYGVYGYPYALPMGYGLRGAYTGLPGRIGLPSLPGTTTRLPAIGGSGISGGGYGGRVGAGAYRPPSGLGGYHPGIGAPIATRPGLGSPVARPAAPAPSVHVGGRR